MRVSHVMVAAAIVTTAWVIAPLASTAVVMLPDPAVDDALASSPSRASAVLAGGCFWGIEELYQHVRGVTDAVKITYDPSQITYGQLLKIFFSVAHDPTQRGGQGPDTGQQYRSVVFAAGERQQQVSQAYIEQLAASHVFKRGITTQVVPLSAFYAAEDYHQDYASHHPSQPYIVMNDLPKVEALRKLFPQAYMP